MSLQTTLILVGMALVVGWLYLLFTNSELAFRILYNIIYGIGQVIWMLFTAIGRIFSAIFGWAFRKR